MAAIEQNVAAHYGRAGLSEAILSGLEALGIGREALRPADLAPVDEFHIGGRAATQHFAEQLRVTTGMRLLDIGCGIGGPSRYFASEHGCRVTGIDLTPEFVEVAGMLAEMVGLSAQVEYRQGSALALPFEDGAFDGAYMLHVGMNIADKARLLAEARRVLRPGGLFGIYDILQGPGGAPAYPMPWAATSETSFLATAEAMQALLAEAGFTLLAVEDRTAFGVDFFQALRGRAQEGGPPPLGLHLLMGADTPIKVANMIQALEQRRVAPTEMVCRA